MVPKQAQLLLSDLNRAAPKLRNQHLVAGLYANGYPLSLPVVCAGAHGDDFCFVEFLDGRLGEEDARCGFGFGLEALDEDTVEEGGDTADGFDCGLGIVSGGRYCTRKVWYGMVWHGMELVEGCERELWMYSMDVEGRSLPF
jgi:hypothetical protein